MARSPPSMAALYGPARVGPVAVEFRQKLGVERTVCPPRGAGPSAHVDGPAACRGRPSSASGVAEGLVRAPASRSLARDRDPIWARVAKSLSGSMGLVTWSSIPASMLFSRSPAMAWAVMAMTTSSLNRSSETQELHGLESVHDGHLDIHEHGVVVARGGPCPRPRAPFALRCPPVSLRSPGALSPTCWLISLSSATSTRAPRSRCMGLAVHVTGLEGADSLVHLAPEDVHDGVEQHRLGSPA